MTRALDRDYVGYGPNPPSVPWPGGARLAISVALNYEEGAERSIALGDETDEPGAVWGGYNAPATERSVMKESFFEYGSRVGIWRLLAILRRHEVAGTVFACGRALELNEEVGRAIVADGHEICSHGYRWASHHGLSRDEEREAIRRAVHAIESVAGVRPVGWYSRDGITENTRGLLVEEGFLYDSNAYNDDIPYFVEAAGREHLVVPYAGDTNDARFWSGPGMATADQFFAVLRDTADCLLAEDTPKLMSVGFHMRIGGRPSVAIALDRFIAYAKQLDGVWFARRDEIARWWIAQAPPRPVRSLHQ